MNIVFMGTPDFAVNTLRAILKSRHHISAVVTVPDKPAGRGLRVSASAVKAEAERSQFPVLQPVSLKDPGFIEELKKIDADLFVVVAFRILPVAVFTLPRFGSINLHASLLPKYRGAAPINWAIIRGERESGVTTFYLKEKVDTGNIIEQVSVEITPEMNAGGLHDLLAETGANVVIKTLDAIEAGKVRLHTQDDLLSTPAPKIFPKDCRISWSLPVHEVHNFIRGLSPHPKAWTTLGDRTIKITSARISGIYSEALPGTILNHARSLQVACGDGVLDVLEVQQEGKKLMGAEEFCRGYRFAEAARFE
jgi:methionyl-tRNA formyltransferase